MSRIAIVGGGPGGLITAHNLLKKTQTPLEITIFEATDRLGGKVQTETFSSVPVLYEAGVAELYTSEGSEDAWKDLLRSLDLAFVEMHDSNATIMNGILVKNHDDLKKKFGKSCWLEVKKFLDKGCKLRSSEQFAAAGWPEDAKHPWAKQTFEDILNREVRDESARKYLKVLAHSDLATEPNLSNGTYGFDNLLVGVPEYCKLYTLQEGIESFIHALSQRLKPHIEFIMNARVKNIAKKADGYHLEFTNDEWTAEEIFDGVIICLPQNWLASIEYREDPELSIAMSRHHQYYDYPAHYLKVAVLFEQPFWQGAIKGDYFQLDSLGGCCVYDEGIRYPTDYGVLNFLFGGCNAQAMANWVDNKIIRTAIESLPTDFAKLAKDTFIEGRVHRWIGTVSGQPGGLPPVDVKKKHLPEPKNHADLVLVGDYLFDSTLNGIVDSSDIATSILLSQLDNLHTYSYRSNPNGKGATKGYPVSKRVARFLKKFN